MAVIVGRSHPSPVSVQPWVLLSGISLGAQAFYAHLLACVRYDVGASDAASVVGLSLEQKDQYIAELVEIQAIERTQSGSYLVHELPPENYSGRRSYSELWPVPDDFEITYELPRQPRTPLELAREEFNRCPEKKRLRKEIDAGLHSCVRCDSVDDLCVDHIVALAVGGLNEGTNYQILCRSCNSRKGIRAA